MDNTSFVQKYQRDSPLPGRNDELLVSDEIEKSRQLGFDRRHPGQGLNVEVESVAVNVGGGDEAAAFDVDVDVGQLGNARADDHVVL